jgi:hypothetical protein
MARPSNTLLIQHLILLTKLSADRQASGNDTWTIPHGEGCGKVFRVGKQRANINIQVY